MTLYLSPLIRLLSATLFLTTAVATPAFSSDYYVDGNAGIDSASGSAEAPWKTITHALNCARGADTVYIRYATYLESVSLARKPVRSVKLIGIAEGERVPVISSSDPDTHTISLMNYQGTIKGLAITGARNANGINCVARNGESTADISDCVIYGNDTGIHVTTSDNSMDRCVPHIHDNTIFSNTSRGIGNMRYSSATIERNYIYNNGSGAEGNGGIGNRDNSSARIAGNVIYRNDHTGISVRDNADPVITSNTICAHDSAGLLSAGIRYRRNPSISSAVILNNIIVGNEYGILSRDDRLYSGSNYNDIWNNFSADYMGFEKGVNDISSDPLFVDPEKENYRLKVGSPCINAADSAQAPDKDIDGTERPQDSGCDMGAYEFSGEAAADVPDAPELSVTVSGVSVTLAWSYVPEATGYILFYAPLDVSYVGHVDLSNSVNISFQLWHDAAFYVAIKACNDAGCSDFSNIEQFKAHN